MKVPIIALAGHENRGGSSSWTLHIVLMSVLFTINIGISSYFLSYYRYLVKDVTSAKFGADTQTTIEHINKLKNGISQRNEHQKLNLLLF